MGEDDGKRAGIAARRRRWPWILLLSVAAMVAAASMLVPPLVRPWVEERLTGELGAPVRIGGLTLNPITQRVTLDDVEVYAAAGDAQPIVAWQRVRAGVAWLSLLDGHLQLRQLAIRGGRLRLSQGSDGGLRLPPGLLEESDTPGSALRISLATLRVQDLDLQLGASLAGGDGARIAIARLAADEVDWREESPGGAGRLTLGESTLTGGRIEASGATLVAKALSVVAAGLTTDGSGALRWQIAGIGGEALELVLPDVPRAGARLTVGPSQLSIAGARGGGDAGAWRIERLEAPELALQLVSEGATREFSGSLQAQSIAPEGFPVRFELAGAGLVRGSGQLQLEPLGFEGTLSGEGLDLADALELATGPGDAVLRSGRASGELSVRLVTRDDGHGPDVDASGTLDLDDVRAFDPDADGVAASWERLHATIEASSLRWDGAGAPRVAVHLGTAEAREPSLDVVRSGAPEQTPEAAPVPPAEDPGPFRLRIDELRIHQSRFALIDRSFEAPVETTVEQIAVVATDVRWPERRAATLELLAPELGAEPLRLAGSVAADSGALSLDGTRIRLAPYTAYVRDFLGRPVLGGELSIRGSLETRADTYDAPVQLVIHDIRLGDPDPDVASFRERYGIPLPLALALLRKANGDLVLDLNLGGDADSLRVSPLQVLGRALREALLKALMTPLRLVGKVAAEAGKIVTLDRRSLQFRPGSVELTTKSQRRLEELGTLLAARPDLAVALATPVSIKDVNRLAAEIREAEGGDARNVSARALEGARALRAPRLSRIREHLVATLGSEAQLVSAEAPEDPQDAPARVTVELEAKPVDVAAPASE